MMSSNLDDGSQNLLIPRMIAFASASSHAPRFFNLLDSKSTAGDEDDVANYGAHAGVNDDSSSDLPLPPLAHVLLRQVLEEMRITIVSCPDEADQIMAIDCRRLNSKQSNGKTVAFCYSGDR